MKKRSEQRRSGQYTSSCSAPSCGRPRRSANLRILCRDAWKSCSGLSRTEAKRRYITSLIDTMRVYASSSPDSRELVDELEFVWDQVKSNVPSNSSSSPPNITSPGLGISTRQPSPHPLRNSNLLGTKREQGITVLSPLSQSQAEDEDEDDDQNEDEFVDAPDSVIADPPRPNPHRFSSQSEPPPSSSSHIDRPPGSPTPLPRKQQKPSPSTSASDIRWRRRVEAALVKMTAEVAALREQLEARRLWSRNRHGKLLDWIWSIASSVIKHVAVDFFFLALLLVWLRRKKDGRLETAVKVLFGDTVAQVRQVGTEVQTQVQKGVGNIGRALGAAPKRGSRAV